MMIKRIILATRPETTFTCSCGRFWKANTVSVIIKASPPKKPRIALLKILIRCLMQTAKVPISVATKVAIMIGMKTSDGFAAPI